MNYSDIKSRILSTQLPIAQKFSQIRKLFGEQPNLVLQAEPGAGKTTLLPLMLLDLVPQYQKILILEPRRLAAKNAALRMAELLEEEVGLTVGYRIKNESKVSSATRIEVITEGILVRMMQSDAELESVGLIIFDEFHERNLDADLGLALAIEIQTSIRNDLKLVVMSATLHVATIQKVLPNAAAIYCEGRSFPVAIEYLSPAKNQYWMSVLISATERALHETQLNILVFLPGKFEIEKSAEQINLVLQRLLLTEQVKVFALYGDLPFEQQQQVIKPSNGKRKIILATNIAETSLTIDGVNCVIDSGLMRQSVFDPNVGFDRLHTTKVSQASAIQRCGRAGRQAAGKCFRLWSESESLRAETTPEILRADLMNFVLETAQWGSSDCTKMHLLDQPNSGALLQASKLLKDCGALNQQAQITSLGKNMLRLAIHPRIALMLMGSVELGVTKLACLIAATLEEKDVFIGQQGNDADFYNRIESLINDPSSSNIRRRITNQQQLLLKKLTKIVGYPENEMSLNESLSYASILVAMVFPDRIAQKRGNGYRLANGSGVTIDAEKNVFGNYLVVIRSGGSAANSKIFQAVNLSLTDLKTHFHSQLKSAEQINWDKNSQSVKSEKVTKFAELILETTVINSCSPTLVAEVLLSGIKQMGLDVLPWNSALRQWQAKISKLVALEMYANEFPDVSDAVLMETLDQWLLPFILGKSKCSQITTEIFTQALKNLLSWQQQQELEKLMPAKIQVASGSHINVDYVSADKPVMKVKLQEVFGEKNSPRVANQQLPVVLHLLSPAQRPLQITEDLSSFWSNSYVEVKKEMKGRYPKHFWPENPLETAPTKYSKRRHK